MNVVTLAGRLHDDPARRDTPQGVVTTFRLAVSDRRHRLWIDVETWGHLAGIAAAHLTRGRAVGVTGTLRNKPYTTGDGQRRDHWFIAAATSASLTSPAMTAMSDSPAQPTAVGGCRLVDDDELDRLGAVVDEHPPGDLLRRLVATIRAARHAQRLAERPRHRAPRR